MAPRAGVPRPVPTETVVYADIFALETLSDEIGEVRDAAIAVEGNVIAWVGKTSDLPDKYASARRVSLENQVVIPGLINTHHHMYQTLTRCTGRDELLFGWLHACYPIWANMTGEDVYRATRLSMAELLLSGCTCSSDHLYMYPNDVLLEDTIRASRDLGMRFHPVRGIVTRDNEHGGIYAPEIVETCESGIKEARRLIEEFHDNSRFSMLRLAIGPTSPFTCDMETMIESAKVALEYPGVRLHTHIAENDEDIHFTRGEHDMRPGEYLEACGWYDHGRAWCAHCVRLNDDECSQFAMRKVGVAHCPISNGRLGSGIAPIREMLDAGVNVGLGVDGSSSNDAGTIINEARTALILQRARLGAKGLTVKETLKIAVQGGAGNLGRDDVGVIAPGYAADFVGWRVKGPGAAPSFSGALHAPVSALILCDAGRVTTNVINGEVIVEDGTLKSFDLETIIAEHNESSARLNAGRQEAA